MNDVQNKNVVDRTKILSEDEWLEIINLEAQSPDISEEAKRKIAKALTHHYMTIDDAIELTEQQLVTKFHINSRNIVDQICEWQKKYSQDAMQTTKEVSSPSLYEEKPLVGLYETMKNEITEDDVIEAFQHLRTISATQTGGFFQNYKDFIDDLIEYGSSRYPFEKRIWYRCRSCRKVVWLAENMGAFTSFPACFRCQLKSWAGIWGIKMDPIPDDPLD